MNRIQTFFGLLEINRELSQVQSILSFALPSTTVGLEKGSGTVDAKT